MQPLADLSGLAREQTRRETDLSDEDREILRRAGEGATNREIGQALYLAEGTVRNLVSGILAKLAVGSRAEAAARFARRAPGEP